MGEGGPAAEVNVTEEPNLPPARSGDGGVHHVAFRTTAKDYEAGAQRLQDLPLPTSGPVDRYYFQSLYFREPNGILFELATDEPGFAVDEAEGSRWVSTWRCLHYSSRIESRIEAGLKPLV